MKPKQLLFSLFLLTAGCVFLRATAIASKADPVTFATYSNDRYGFTIQYPERWRITVPLSNSGNNPNVIEQRIVFGDDSGGINIDVFPNHNEASLADWYATYQQHFMPEDAPIQYGLSVAGDAAIYALDLGDLEFPPRHTTILAHGDFIFRIEYQATDGGHYLEIYRAMLSSLKFVNGNMTPVHLFDLTDIPLQIREPLQPNDQGCCGYTDPNPNPYLCYSGNCTWWARFKRPDTGGQSYPYWGNASNWRSRAIEEGFTVNGTPSTGAIAWWSGGNHVAYVESLSGSTAAMSDMDYLDFDCVVDRWNQSNFSGIQFIHPSTDTEPPTISFNVPATSQWYNTDQTLSWTVSDSGGSGVAYSRWGWNDSTLYNLANGPNGSTTLAVAGQGQHTLYVQAWDQAGNPSSVQNRGWFGYDTQPPSNPNSVNSGCGAENNVWQNTCNDPHFTWSGASDGVGSGVKDYQYYWGTSATGSPITYTTSAGFDPTAVPGSVATYYLRVAARDQLNQQNPNPSTLFVLRYDGANPTVSLTINNGAGTANQVSVSLDLTASDAGSGVDKVRVSNNGLNWSEWQPYAATIPWTLPALNRQAHTVYVQVRDRAGNVSETANATITLDLYPVMPHSAGYRICANVINVGGQVGLQSSSYRLTSTIGESGSGYGQSGGYRWQGGFLADLTECLPIEHAAGEGYEITHWVIASGGSLRGSASYTLGDTAGETFASAHNQFSSGSYRLSSGFWGDVAGAAATPPPPPTPVPTMTPTPTPIPGPTATPVPGGFGVSVNDGNLYTNSPNVTVRVSAPNVTQVRLSNDGGYLNAGWMSYEPTLNWTIDTYGNYVLPRFVYAWFRDAEGIVYGAYMDDIIYDPVPPEGEVALWEEGGNAFTLYLHATDDNSGVAEMRVGDDASFAAAEWLPYQQVMAWEWTGNPVYAQFRDRAGNLSPVYHAGLTEMGEHNLYLPIIIR